VIWQIGALSEFNRCCIPLLAPQKITNVQGALKANQLISDQWSVR